MSVHVLQTIQLVSSVSRNEKHHFDARAFPSQTYWVNKQAYYRKYKLHFEDSPAGGDPGTEESNLGKLNADTIQYYGGACTKTHHFNAWTPILNFWVEKATEYRIYWVQRLPRMKLIVLSSTSCAPPILPDNTERVHVMPDKTPVTSARVYFSCANWSHHCCISMGYIPRSLIFEICRYRAT